MTFNVIAVVDGVRTIFGRYWGALEHVPFLHFYLGYAALIERAIELEVDVIEPGAGGEHKQARGFDPAVTTSVHHLADPCLRRAVAEHVARGRGAIEAQRKASFEEAPWRGPAHT
jgi:predicted N-acyltransferase